MNTPAVLSALALAVSGSVLFVVLGQPPAAEARPEAAGPDSDLAGRLEALAAENEDLRARVQGLELVPAPTPREPVVGYVSRDEFEAFRDEVLAALEARGGGKAAPKRIEDEVAVALDAIRRSEGISKATENLDKRSQDVDRRVQGWSRWLDLDESQAEQLSVLMEDRNAREREVLLSAKESGDGAGYEEQLQEIQRDFHRTVRTMLSPEQEATMNQKVGDDD